MDLAQTVTNAIVVGAVGIILGFLVHGVRAEMRAFRAEVRQEIGTFRAEVRQEIGTFRAEVREDNGSFRAEVRADNGSLRAEVRQDIAGLRREIGDLRSDLTQVALAVGARPRADRNR